MWISLCLNITAVSQRQESLVIDTLLNTWITCCCNRGRRLDMAVTPHSSRQNHLISAWHLPPSEILCHLNKLDVCICASPPIALLPLNGACETWENCGTRNTVLHWHCSSELCDMKGTTWKLYICSLFPAQVKGNLKLHMVMRENKSM